ncbi:hypothetical protein [Roseovarius sp. M141]|uniref:hypothetical protein n=1 Tax=Roseovarius sp. M141 TaxID=2583806 RepID=UPI0020CC29C2|nr:hypothetical protein [Roseovarius sp. M141]MCQ0093510.1 hypothetical protein [Roseovarius sp. M141]
MHVKGATTENTVSTAAAAAAQRDLLRAEVSGYKNIRFYADMAQTELIAQRHHLVPQGGASNGRASWLALISGDEPSARRWEPIYWRINDVV